MERIHKADQSERDQQRGHTHRIRNDYHVDLFCKTFGMPDQKMFFCSKKLPGGWRRDQWFPKPAIAHASVQKIIADTRTGILFEKKEPAEIHHRLIEFHRTILGHDGDGSHSECLFLRHARKYFKK